MVKVRFSDFFARKFKLKFKFGFLVVAVVEVVALVGYGENVENSISPTHI